MKILIYLIEFSHFLLLYILSFLYSLRVKRRIFQFGFHLFFAFSFLWKHVCVYVRTWMKENSAKDGEKYIRELKEERLWNFNPSIRKAREKRLKLAQKSVKWIERIFYFMMWMCVKRMGMGSILQLIIELNFLQQLLFFSFDCHLKNILNSQKLKLFL